MMKRILPVAMVLVVGVAALFLVRGCATDAPRPVTVPAATSEVPVQPALAARVPQPEPVAPEPRPSAEPAVPPGWTVLVEARSDGATLPVSGARVTVVTASAQKEALTDASGAANFPAGLRGPATIWVCAAGQGASRTVIGPVGSETVRITLCRGATVRVAWKSATGTDLSESDFRSRSEREGTSPTVIAVADDANSSGTWNDAASPLHAPAAGWQIESPIEWSGSVARIGRRFASGRWRFIVPRPGALPFVSGAIDLADGDDACIVVGIEEAPASRCVRFVNSATGDPVAAADVRPWLELIKDFAYVAGSPTRTRADGCADIPLPANAAGHGRAVFTVESQSAAGEFDEAALLSRPEEQPLVLRILPAARIAGVAFERPGVVAAGREVSWTRKGRTVRCVCDAGGRFSLEGIALRRGPEELVPVALSIDGEAQFQAVTASAGRTVDVVLGSSDAAAAVGRLDGSVRAGGRGLAGVQVVLVQVGGGKTLRHASTAADGTFRFESVPVGGANLHVTCGDPRVSDAFRISTTSPLQIRSAETSRADYDLPDAALRVRVVAAGSRRPVAGVNVIARPEDPRDLAGRFPGSRFNPGWSANTDADGFATLVGLAPAAAHRIEVTRGAGQAAALDGCLPGTTAAPSDYVLEIGR